ncbi:N-acetyltransferase esco2 [Gryganskiella cystojenkinii]|nr:N-acetyltransferase esco2 [Gryganskiella cystojenkinii]
METPPLHRTGSGSEPASSPGPTTPTREYKFHKTVRNTYGRAKPASDSPMTSPSRSATTSSLWDQYTPTSTPSSSQDRRTSTGTPRSQLADRLWRTNLHPEGNDEHDDTENGFIKEQETPSARKRELLTNVVNPISPKKSRIEPLQQWSQDSPTSTTDDSNDPRRSGRRRSGNFLTSPRTSPSPPSSPNTKKTTTVAPTASRRTSANRRTLLEDEGQKGSNAQTITIKKEVGGSEAKPKQPQQQATLSAFFTTRAGKGTGILKSKIPSATSFLTSSSTTVASTGTTSKDPKLQATEPPKKLEQMYLAFSVDRSKPSSKSPSSSTNPSKIPLSTRTTHTLNRESERTKRFHCPQCGMPYVKGQIEDEKIHDRHHRTVLGGIEYPGYKNETVVARYADDLDGKSVTTTNRRTSSGDFQDSRIVVISMEPSLGNGASTGTSSHEKRKVREVLKTMNEELGSVEFDPESLKNCKVFLYISGKKKVVGCVVAERIEQGFEILASPSSSQESASSSPLTIPSCSPSLSTLSRIPSSSEVTILPTPAPSTALSVASSSTSSSSDQEGSAIFCSTVPEPAICGINRIWVSKLYRRQKVASRLLDAVRDKFIHAYRLEKQDLAFSQPTGDGRALARRYLGKEQFLVYVE